MTDAEIRAILEAAPDVGKIKHIDFGHFCRVMERKDRRTGEITETLYMDVDGKLAMCIVDHALQDKTWEQFPPVIMEQSAKRLTLMMKVESQIYGTRYGIASSRANGPAAEGSHPWESAETSALGRALVNMGYGLLPGAGRASSEDMEGATPKPKATKKRKPRAKKATPSPTPKNGPGGVETAANGSQADITNISDLWGACVKILGVKPPEIRERMGFLSLQEWLEENNFSCQEGFEAIRDKLQAEINGMDERG
jgi:hypothetical protein